jgi:Fe2+ or Zn2+ uptake regulation protein
MAAITRMQEQSGLMVVDFLEKLPDSFTTADAQRIGRDYGVSPATVHNWLRAMRQTGLLVKVRFGEYCKL